MEATPPLGSKPFARLLHAVRALLARDVVCAHHLLTPLEHSFPDPSVDEHKNLTMAAVRWLGISSGAVGSRSSTAGVGPFVTALELMWLDGTCSTGMVPHRAMPPRSPASAAAAVDAAEQCIDQGQNCRERRWSINTMTVSALHSRRLGRLHPVRCFRLVCCPQSCGH
jgi:hypothetical protein